MMEMTKAVAKGFLRRLGLMHDLYKPIYPFPDSDKALRKMIRINREYKVLEETNDEFVIHFQDFPLRLRKCSSDIDVFWQVVIRKEYEPVIRFAILNGIKIENVIDLGGNIGLFSLIISEAFRDCRVIALEADRSNFRQFVTNTSQKVQRVAALNKAIWHKSGLVYVQGGFRDGRDWARNVSEVQNNEPIESTTICDLISEYSLQTIDLLKIDIEGGESQLFGSESDLSFLEQTKIIALEIHDEFDCRAQIVEILSGSFVLFDSGELTVGLNKNFFK